MSLVLIPSLPFPSWRFILFRIGIDMGMVVGWWTRTRQMATRSCLLSSRFSPRPTTAIDTVTGTLTNRKSKTKSDCVDCGAARCGAVLCCQWPGSVCHLSLGLCLFACIASQRVRCMLVLSCLVLLSCLGSSSVCKYCTELVLKTPVLASGRFKRILVHYITLHYNTAIAAVGPLTRCDIKTPTSKSDVLPHLFGLIHSTNLSRPGRRCSSFSVRS